YDFTTCWRALCIGIDFHFRAKDMSEETVGDSICGLEAITHGLDMNIPSASLSPSTWFVCVCVCVCACVCVCVCVCACTSDGEIVFLGSSTLRLTSTACP